MCNTRYACTRNPQSFTCVEILQWDFKKSFPSFYRPFIFDVVVTIGTYKNALNTNGRLSIYTIVRTSKIRVNSRVYSARDAYYEAHRDINIIHYIYVCVCVRTKFRVRFWETNSLLFYSVTRYFGIYSLTPHAYRINNMYETKLCSFKENIIYRTTGENRLVFARTIDIRRGR